MSLPPTGLSAATSGAQRRPSTQTTATCCSSGEGEATDQQSRQQQRLPLLSVPLMCVLPMRTMPYVADSLQLTFICCCCTMHRLQARVIMV